MGHRKETKHQTTEIVWCLEANPNLTPWLASAKSGNRNIEVQIKVYALNVPSNELTALLPGRTLGYKAYWLSKCNLMCRDQKRLAIVVILWLWIQFLEPHYPCKMTPFSCFCVKFVKARGATQKSYMCALQYRGHKEDSGIFMPQCSQPESLPCCFVTWWSQGPIHTTINSTASRAQLLIMMFPFSFL